MMRASPGCPSMLTRPPIPSSPTRLSATKNLRNISVHLPCMRPVGASHHEPIVVLGSTYEPAGLVFFDGRLRVIEGLGLTTSDWLLYRELLWNPRASLPDLQTALGGAAGDIKAPLGRLESLGLVVESTSAPSGLRPVYPQVGLQRILNEKRNHHDEEARRLRTLDEQIAEFTDEFSEHRRDYEVSLLNEITDPAEMTSRVNELTRTCREEVLSLVTHTVQPSSLEQARRGDRELLDRGVRARGIYLLSALDDEPTREYLHWLEGEGALVRVAPSLPIRMIIFDGAAAVVSRRALDPGHGALIVQSPGLIAALVSLFEAYWTLATTITANGVPARSGPTRMEQDVLALLAQGMKDDAIAHRLDLSVRTVRRVLNQLYERTGSESRFELGVKATRFGWL
ncbi:MAG: hypothetical protein EOL89_02520 [Actinobacteria bacterium]|nr:hypothetical protein [Actinomycetota bacterium]